MTGSGIALPVRCVLESLVVPVGRAEHFLAGDVLRMVLLHVILRLTDEFFLILGFHRMTHRARPAHLHPTPPVSSLFSLAKFPPSRRRLLPTAPWEFGTASRLGWDSGP